MDLKSYMNRPAPRRSLLWNRTLLTTAVLVVAAISILLAAIAGAFLHSKGQLDRDQITSLIKQANPSSLISQITEQDSAALSTIDLRIGFAELQRLEEKRGEAIAEGILLAEESDLLPFDLVSGDEVFSGQIRLKGDWVDHLAAGKPSFRIELDSGEAFDGMTRFSLQHPGTRNYLREWAFFEHARSLGLIVPRYGFIKVTINGASVGIYAIEEHFTAEMLEGQQQRPAAILKWDEDALWVWRAESNWGPGSLHWSLISGFYTNNSLPEVFQAKKVAGDLSLQQQVDTGTALLLGLEQGLINTSDVFDVEKLATFGALADLWGAKHGLEWHNLRFYFNPFTGLLEPVIFDMEPAATSEQFLSDGMLKINQDRVILDAYVSVLGRLSQPDEIEKLVESQRDAVDRLLGVLRTEFGEKVENPWSFLVKRAEAIRNGLNPGVSLLAVRDRSALPAGSIYVRNLTRLPMEVLGFTVNGGPLQNSTEAVVDAESVGLLEVTDSEVVLVPAVEGAGVCPGPPSCVRFELGDIPADASIQVASRIGGADLWSWTTVASLTQPANGPTVALPGGPQDVVDAHEFLVLDESNLMFHATTGSWDVTGDLFLPPGYGLTVKAGTTLRFAEGAVLRISGPLRLLGSSQGDVVLEASDQTWGGVAVIRSPVGSKIEYTSIRQTTGVDRGGWQLTGGVTFFESDVDIEHSRFGQSFAEDALNIFRSHFTLTDTTFTQAISDGFDGDFVTGLVRGGSYADIGGDAIDFAGSEVEVVDVEFRQIGDKALSIGETSVVTVRNVRIEDVELGIVSKDRSEVDVEETVISRASIAALAAYQKKPNYGPSIINATSVQIIDSSSTVFVDRHSWIVIDGKRIDGTELDIGALYDAGILGN